ncbi:MAG: hypothetical protein ABL928_13290 [Sphingorhabdus sp.]
MKHAVLMSLALLSTACAKYTDGVGDQWQRGARIGKFDTINDAEKFISLHDEDRDGKLTLKEFSKSTNLYDGDQITVSEIENTFAGYDVNSDSYIDISDFKILIDKFG